MLSKILHKVFLGFKKICDYIGKVTIFSHTLLLYSTCKAGWMHHVLLFYTSNNSLRLMHGPQNDSELLSFYAASTLLLSALPGKWKISLFKASNQCGFNTAEGRNRSNSVLKVLQIKIP